MAKKSPWEGRHGWNRGGGEGLGSQSPGAPMGRVEQCGEGEGINRPRQLGCYWGIKNLLSKGA